MFYWKIVSLDFIHFESQTACLISNSLELPPIRLFQDRSRNQSPISSLMDVDRRKRNRTFIDPVSEVPRLEEWFMLNTHPSHTLIARYTEELNQLPYRQKFPKLEQKNIQFWFKNRRAKCKRMNNCL